MKNCAICKEDFYSLDKHHIQSECYGGTNKKSNICKICPNCHRETHIGTIIIEGWFQCTSGFELIWRPKGHESITGIEDPKCYLYDKKGTSN